MLNYKYSTDNNLPRKMDQAALKKSDYLALLTFLTRI